jgi:hypothetical protein
MRQIWSAARQIWSDRVRCAPISTKLDATPAGARNQPRGTPYAVSATRPEARRTPGPGTFTELPKNPFIQPLFYHNRTSSSKPWGRGWGCTTDFRVDFRVRRVRKTPRKRRTEVRRRGVSSKLPHCRDLDELRPSAGSACCRLGAEAAIGRRFSSAGLPMPERPPPAESRWQT